MGNAGLVQVDSVSADAVYPASVRGDEIDIEYIRCQQSSGSGFT
jgi:hypothetical protein